MTKRQIKLALLELAIVLNVEEPITQTQRFLLVKYIKSLAENINNK